MPVSEKQYGQHLVDMRKRYSETVTIPSITPITSSKSKGFAIDTDYVGEFSGVRINDWSDCPIFVTKIIPTLFALDI